MKESPLKKTAKPKSLKVAPKTSRGTYAARRQNVQPKVIVSSKNNERLEKYLTKLQTKNEPMPYITEFSKATGVSTATISRFARNKGFYNYSAMRMDFISNAEVNSFAQGELHKLVNFLNVHSRFTIVASRQTRLIGIFMQERLTSMGLDVELVVEGDQHAITPNRAVIILSLAGERVPLNAEMLRQPHLLVTCLRTQNENAVSLYQFAFQTQTSLELFRSIRKVNEWIQRAIDVYWLNKNGVQALH